MPPLRNKRIRRVIRTVERTIREFDMLHRDDAVLVAVSGGPDSVALLHLLLELSPGYGIRLAVAHLNHGLRRTESDGDQRFCMMQAERLGLTCHSGRVDVVQYQRRHGLSLEEAARQVRYSFLRQTAADHGFSKIAIGHQADDNAESVLMFMMRGAGLSGLAGIAPVRDQLFIRPLIRVRRTDIVAYNTARGLESVADRTNTDLSYARNRVRHRLLPLLRDEFNPRVVDVLNRLADVARNDDFWMDSNLQPLWQRLAIQRAPDRIAFPLPDFNLQPLAARRRLIRHAVRQVKGDLRRIGLRHIDAVVQLAERDGSGRLCLPGPVRVQREPIALTVLRLEESSHRIQSAVPPDYHYVVEPPAELTIKEASVRIKLTELPVVDLSEVKDDDRNVEFFDMDLLEGPMIVRNSRAGDRFSPLGVNGSQKLKKFFIDHKIAPAKRKRCPLLLDGNRILWVAGYRRACECLIQPQTRRVLKAELLLA